MRCPSKSQILDAAKVGRATKNTLMKLFPEAFEESIHKGEIYEWGTNSDGGSGLVVDNGNYFNFINFRTGDIYLCNISKNLTSKDLNCLLLELNYNKLHNCFNGHIRGPMRFKSWSTK